MTDTFVNDPVSRVMLITLGCPKNLVDSEHMCRIIRENGMELVDRPDEADAIVVNTCGFIESAKQEAIDTLLEMAEYKERGTCRYLVAAGCLSQRYAGDIAQDLPEVDAILGTAHYGAIGRVLRDLPGRKDLPVLRCDEPGTLDHLTDHRPLSTDGYAYLKISEGCSHHCSYCAIPAIRGPYQSRPMEDLVAEARYLVGEGRPELILVAQDTTRYGSDLPGDPEPVTLARLLERLAGLEGVQRIRMLYGYLDAVTDDLIHCMARHPKIARYLDIPLQHLSDRVLRAMNRRDTWASIRERVAELREALPGIVLRSTVIVGFPGETEEDFTLLRDRLAELRLDRLGCFIFSPEEGTPAARRTPTVPADVARRRYEQIMAQQQEISLMINQARVGTTCDVMLDFVSEDGIFYCGRSDGEAPDIDPVIRVALSGEDPGPGRIVPVRIMDADAYEMTGVTV